MKRIVDFLGSLVALLIFSLPLLVVAIFVKVSSPGPILFWSDRVGRSNRIYQMPKFRTMLVETPAVATHLLHNPDQWLTPIGSFLRRSSLDELPQLWCILNGDMSFVGPRPALFNQQHLIALRTEAGVHKLKPGMTGWAQINGRDKLLTSQKVALDIDYMERQSLIFDLKILLMTLPKVFAREGISH